MQRFTVGFAPRRARGVRIRRAQDASGNCAGSVLRAQTDDRDVSAQLGRAPRRCDAGRAGAEDDDVELGGRLVCPGVRHPITP